MKTRLKQASDKGKSPKSRLDMELRKAGLTHRHPPAPKDGNCLFHAMNDQLIRRGRVSQSATKVRCDLVNYLRSNPTTPDGTHFREFIKHGAWDIYLRRMAMDGEWGDWIALWRLINMFEIPVAVVSSLGETGLNIIHPGATQRSNECACSSHARAILARVGMGCIISIGTSKRQNGGRFKFRGICFQLAGIRWRQNS